MLARKLDSFLDSFYENERHKALLLTGARQVGKTWAVRNLAERKFKHFIEINFVETPAAKDIFIGAQNARQILLRLSAFTTEPLVAGETLILFDEVQECSEIVTQIKFLVDEGSYRYALSGSLLGVELKDVRSEPVGYMDVVDVFPFDLEEFCKVIGVSDKVINELRDAYENHRPVDKVVHEQMMSVVNLYLIVGGMPAAVNAKNKRFILKKLNENFKLSRYQNSFIWMWKAGVAIPTFNVTEPVAPLKLNQQRNLFKLFQNDVGLLAYQYSNGIQMEILKGNVNVNFGAVYENFVAQELVSKGYPTYYFNNKKLGELDFVIDNGSGKVIPIEVKSGKEYYVHSALDNVMDVPNYGLKQAYVLCNENLTVHGDILNLPIYMIMFFKKAEVSIEQFKLDISALLA